LQNIIKKAKQDVDELGDEIRLIAVVSSVSEEVKNACWALEPSIKLVTYNAFKQGDEITLIPNIILDTVVGGEREIRAPKTEEDHFRGRENMKTVYQTLISKIKGEIDSSLKPNPSPQYYIGLSHKKLFCTIHVKKEWLRIDLPLTSAEVNNSTRYTKYPVGEWGYVNVRSPDEVDSELINWIKIAYTKS
jgi:hypothetical protein